MARKPQFPEEPITKPAQGRPPPAGPPRQSGPAPKGDRADETVKRSEAPTMPPPSPHQGTPSGIRPRPPRRKAATVDEVVADLSKDPRAEVDDEEDERPRKK